MGPNGISLYTDDGTYYWGNDKSALRRAVIKKDGGDDLFKRDIAAVLFAVKGDIGQARARMAVAKERGEKYVPPKPLTAEQKKEITGNHIWTNAVDALIAAPENTQVRAGVLRIMASMPRVRVTKTTTAGQPTLTLADGWPTAGGATEKLVINAGTGRPIAMTSGGSDVRPRTIYYHTTRVTLSDIEVGKF